MDETKVVGNNGDSRNVSISSGKVEVQGNPFDIIIQSSIEYLRDCFFNVARYRKEDNYVPSNENDTHLIDRIKEQYNVLGNMTNDQVNILRTHSILYKEIDFLKMNDFLFSISKAIPTVWSQCVPVFEPEVEMVLFGDSDDYKKRKKLKDLAIETAKHFKDFQSFDYFLSKCIDFIDRNDDSYGDNIKTDEFIKKHSLDIDDICIMQSAINKCLLKEDGRSVKQLMEKL